jgi:hypothetical protein
MAQFVTCVCGEHHKITKWNAGTRRRCTECKRLIEFPQDVKVDKLEVVEEGEELEEVSTEEREEEREEEQRRQSVGKMTGKKKGVCIVCEEEDRGKFVNFWAGFLVKSWSEYDPALQRHVERRICKKVHKTGVFLCEACARWHYYKWAALWALGLGAVALVALPLGVYLLTVGPFYNQWRTGGLLLGCGISAMLTMFWPIYLLLRSRLNRNLLQTVAIRLSRDHLEDRGEGDVFLTNKEYSEIEEDFSHLR